MDTMNSIELPNLDEINCIFCQAPIQKTDKKMDYICGCHTVHTECGLSNFGNQLDMYGKIKCYTCESVIYEPHYYNDTESINEDVESEEFRNDIKNIKLKQRNLNKPVKIFNKKLLEECAKYKDLTKVHVSTLKLLYKETMKSIKASSEYKSALSALRTHSLHVNKFKRKYKLNYRNLVNLGINLQKYRRYGYGDFFKIKRKLRILIQ